MLTREQLMRFNQLFHEKLKPAMLQEPEQLQEVTKKVQEYLKWRDNQYTNRIEKYINEVLMDKFDKSNISHHEEFGIFLNQQPFTSYKFLEIDANHFKEVAVPIKKQTQTQTIKIKQLENGDNNSRIQAA